MGKMKRNHGENNNNKKTIHLTIPLSSQRRWQFTWQSHTLHREEEKEDNSLDNPTLITEKKTIHLTIPHFAQRRRKRRKFTWQPHTLHREEEKEEDNSLDNPTLCTEKKKKKKTIHLTTPHFAQRRRRRQFTWQPHSHHREDNSLDNPTLSTTSCRGFLVFPSLEPLSKQRPGPLPSSAETTTIATTADQSAITGTVHHISSTNYYGWSTQLLPADPLAIAASRWGPPPSSTVASRPRRPKDGHLAFHGDPELWLPPRRSARRPLPTPPPSPNYPVQN